MVRDPARQANSQPSSGHIGRGSRSRSGLHPQSLSEEVSTGRLDDMFECILLLGPPLLDSICARGSPQLGLTERRIQPFSFPFLVEQRNRQSYSLNNQVSISSWEVWCGEHTVDILRIAKRTAMPCNAAKSRAPSRTSSRALIASFSWPNKPRSIATPSQPAPANLISNCVFPRDQADSRCRQQLHRWIPGRQIAPRRPGAQHPQDAFHTLPIRRPLRTTRPYASQRIPAPCPAQVSSLRLNPSVCDTRRSRLA